MRWLVALALLGIGCVGEGPDASSITPDEIAPHVRFLSNDLLEGRGVGGRGEELTIEYLATQLELAGAEPAGEGGTYFQTVPLVEIKTQGSSSVRLAGRELEPLTDYVGNNERQTGREVFDAEVVFVGHGIVAPEFEWDDFKGVDVGGKLLVLFTNEPPSEDEAFFGGKALTYYGRWTFKFEEAARRGAAGVLIVHTDETAGYPWDVVRNSWSGGQPYVEAKPGEAKLALAGWISSEAAESLFRSSPVARDMTLDGLLDAANQQDFTPVELGVRAQVDLRSSIVPIQTRNVVASFPGGDPALADEAVLYTAHWDHIGMHGEGEDRIYNGAVDNATGCAVLLSIARAFGDLESAPPRRVLLAFVGAEESGLLGSAYYAANPVVGMGKTAVNLNYDGLYPFGKTSDLSLPGYERTSLSTTVEALAAEFGLALTPDAHPEQGYYYRSDQFSLAKHGVPAFSIKSGSKYPGRPSGWGEEKVAQYRESHYHQPSDEFREDWDFAGIAELARFGFELGRIVADQPDLPTWKQGDEFLAARQRSWQ
ncbi:MAG: M28 family peptidase [Bryobacterales bacterium]|nr:M28 family peptidase [Bryobacterales bacterium]MDE0262808.1 M28 family peptidase [Bryobacterales bacterium]MDE0622621.1 M28 family peptidase [Bryobacterales bacterium]